MVLVDVAIRLFFCRIWSRLAKEIQLGWEWSGMVTFVARGLIRITTVDASTIASLI